VTEEASRSVRLLYLMHVDWNWIWQRPQAIASELANHPRVRLRVAYLPNWRRSQLTRNSSPVSRSPIPQLPMGRLGVIRVLNRLLARTYVSFLLWRWHPDAVVITYPTLVAALPSSFTGPLFYDCMDLAGDFAPNDDERSRLVQLEDGLMRRAARVFVSSNNIGEALRTRHSDCRPVLVRNGFDGLERPEIEEAGQFADPNRTVRLGYFGTVSTWFDWRLILMALTDFPWLEVHLWGPLAAAPPSHARIVAHEPVAHADLGRAVRDMDALIMPFVVTGLIRGVDPVKLYEYVAIGKPVVSVFYPELIQFEGLVHFYDGPDEFRARLLALRRSRPAMLPPRDRAESFLASATWRSRASVMLSHVTAVLDQR
jgi:hypothetical protein